MTQHKYDVIYILDPNATVEEGAAVSAKVEQIVADSKGAILKKDDWGKRRLAYTVAKHREGHYVFYHVSVSTDTIAEITRNLRLLEKVIKFSIVKDEISHLKAKVKPPRIKTSTEGSQSRPGFSRSSNPTHRSHDSSSRSTGSTGSPHAGSTSSSHVGSTHSAGSTSSPQASSGQAGSPQAVPTNPSAEVSPSPVPSPVPAVPSTPAVNP